MKPCLYVQAVFLLLCGRSVYALSSSTAGGGSAVADLTVGLPDDDDLGTAAINQIENQIISFARMTEGMNRTEGNENMKKFIGIFRNKIDGKMIPYLHNQTAMSKANIESKYQKVVECANTRNQGAQKTKRVDMSKSFVSQSEAHVTCRGKQAKMGNDLNSQKVVLKKKKKDKEELCKMQKDEENTDPIPVTICNAGFSRAGAEANYKEFKKKVEKYEELKRNCKKATDDYNDQVKTVEDMTQKYNTKKGECDVLQRNVMKYQCDYKLQVFAHETEYVGCYQEALNAYEEATWRAKISMNKRRHEYRALLRIKCLLVGLADGEASKLSSQLVYCRSQTYSGVEMTFPMKPAPQQQTQLSMIKKPCETLNTQKSGFTFWMGSKKKKVEAALLVSDPDCPVCELPPTPAPTPMPTPPPPPGKVKCEYLVKEELVNARYNSSLVKLVGTRMWPSWHEFTISYERGQALELEARGRGSGACDKQGTLVLKCNGDDRTGGWKKYKIEKGFVVVSGGSVANTYDKPFKNPCFADYKSGKKKWKGAWYPDTATKFAKFVVGPDYDTTCTISADNEIVSIKYGGQLVSMGVVKKNSGTMDPTKAFQMNQAYKAKVFKFNYVVNNTLEVVAKNFPTETQSCDMAGLGLSCKSSWPAWDKYDTTKGNVQVSSSSDGTTFGAAATPCTSGASVSKWTTDKNRGIGLPPAKYIWTNDGKGPFGKFVFKGNTLR